MASTCEAADFLPSAVFRLRPLSQEDAGVVEHATGLWVGAVLSYPGLLLSAADSAHSQRAGQDGGSDGTPPGLLTEERVLRILLSRQGGADAGGDAGADRDGRWASPRQ